MKSYDKCGGENLTWKIKFKAWDKEENEWNLKSRMNQKKYIS